VTIPNVTITWCVRKTKCKWCPEHIEGGQPLVTVFFWNKGSTEHKGFNTKQYYHPQCWIGQGMDYLNRNPYVPYKRSRALPLTPEQTKQRGILLRRKCSLDQRRRNLRTNLPNHDLMEAKIARQVAELMLEIAPIGGIPKRWLEPWQP